MKKQSSDIYVVFIRAHTGLGDMARKSGKTQYTHVSVSLNEQLTEFVAFSRRLHNNAFACGFTHEKLNYYAFGEHQTVRMKVCRIPMSLQSYESVLKYINDIENDKRYIFNLLLPLTVKGMPPIRIYKAENCFSFVAKLLEISGVVELPKKNYRMLINDLENLLQPYVVQEREFDKLTTEEAKREEEEYMKHVCFAKKVGSLFLLSMRAIFRFLFLWGVKYPYYGA